MTPGSYRASDADRDQVAADLVPQQALPALPAAAGSSLAYPAAVEDPDKTAAILSSTKRTNVLGETSIKDIGPPDPAMPTIVIRGTNVMGESKVRGPKKTWSWRKAVA